MSTPTPPPPPSPVTPRVLEHLAGTKRWVRFIAVFGFVLSGLMVLVSLLAVAVGLLGHGFPGMEAAGRVGSVLIGGLYFVLALLYVFLCIPLYQYAGAIGRLLQSRSTSGLEEALAHQRRFWRRLGIVALVTLCLYVVAVALAMVVAVVAAMMGARH